MAPILCAAAVGYARRVEWPAAFYDWRAGVACPLCDEGRPEATAHAVRFFAGEVADAYLVRADIQRGLSIVVWRGRHVVERPRLPAPRRRASAAGARASGA